MAPTLHPLLDNGLVPGNPNHTGGKLHCHCKIKPIEVTLTGQVLHNHACGCSKCWKPAGALFSIAAVIPREKVSVTANADKLAIIDKSALIQRNACRECGVHMYGRIEQEHPFKGLDFVHVELSDEKGWQEPQFASFVSSIIEHGFDPNRMGEVRGEFKELGLGTYDCLSTELMDFIATWTAKKAGRLPA
ncbi:S-glutathione synthase [Thozetella sp. PMI_491]|nr:S-glutathione synthase [Thozetella sp. PMI_491]